MSAQQNFWARRQAGVAAEAKAEEAAAEAEVIATEQAAFDDMSEQEVLTALELPDPDTLVQGDDFSVFMAKAVPDQIRRRALRTLWRSNPVLANVDMLVDYGEDFTDAATVIENMQTAYQVGKGMLKHIEEMARQAEEKANPVEPIEEPEEEIVIAAAEEPEVESVSTQTPPKVVVEDEPDMGDGERVQPTPRRMKSRIEETA